MRIVYVVETYTEDLGYIDNVLPFALAKKGHEIHLLTCGLPPYYQFSAGHFGHLAVVRREKEIERRDGVIIHTLKFRPFGSRLLMRGLVRQLCNIRPDAVIVRSLASPMLLQVIAAKLRIGFRLFTSSGQSYSAMPENIRNGKWYERQVIISFFSRYLIGAFCSLFVNKCIASLEDGARACREFYGITSTKLCVISLGVDTKIFFPATSDSLQAERERLRNKLGITNSHVLCIWTGRMTAEKGLALLAQAIDELVAAGYPFMALFIGSGPERELLRNYGNSLVLDFMKWKDLAPYYRASDVAVWPRSISTSSLDASASGLPVIMSSSEPAKERWEGIGASYKDGDILSLKSVLLEYLDAAKRASDSAAAVSRMRSLYSWNVIAESYLNIIQG